MSGKKTTDKNDLTGFERPGIETLINQILQKNEFDETLFYESAAEFSNQSKIYQDIKLTEIAKKFKLSKKTLSSYIKDATPPDETAERGTAIIDQVEHFINKNWNVRKNVISNIYEMQPKGSETWETANENIIWRKLQKSGFSFSTRDIKALFMSDFSKQYNPFENYFYSLPEHDGIDYIKQLADLITLSDDSLYERQRFEKHLKKMFVRCIACSLGMGFNKQVFIIRSDAHHIGKTSLIRWFCPPALDKYIIENVSADKDLLRSTAENFIFNIDEMADLSKYEINMFKTVISKDKVKVRIQYDTKFSTLPRRVNFFGTTNEIEFLRDVTGSVRFIIFDVKKIDFNYSKLDINKIWSQAYNLLINGFEYNLNRYEIDQNEEINKRYYVNNPEIDLLRLYFKPAERSDGNAEHLTTTEIMQFLTVQTGGSIKLNHITLGKALKYCGFVQIQKYDEKNRYQVKGYFVKKI